MRRQGATLREGALHFTSASSVHCTSLVFLHYHSRPADELHITLASVQAIFFCADAISAQGHIKAISSPFFPTHSSQRHNKDTAICHYEDIAIRHYIDMADCHYEDVSCCHYIGVSRCHYIGVTMQSRLASAECVFPCGSLQACVGTMHFAPSIHCIS